MLADVVLRGSRVWGMPACSHGIAYERQLLYSAAFRTPVRFGIEHWAASAGRPEVLQTKGVWPAGFLCAGACKAKQHKLNSEFRRGVRVVEGARLESVYTLTRIEGSNPSLSAN